MTADVMIANTHLLAKLDEALDAQRDADSAIDRDSFPDGKDGMTALREHVNEVMEPYRKAVSDLLAQIDVTSLPVGTRISFRTTQGWDGSVRRTGHIARVTPKSYVVDTGTYGEARVPRDRDGWSKRSANVVAGPGATAKAREASRALAKIHEEMTACYHAVKVAEEALNEVRQKRNEDALSLGLITLNPVEKAVIAIMRERHAEEWAALAAETEATMYAGKPSREEVEAAQAALDKVKARTDAERARLEAQAREYRKITMRYT